MNDKWDMRFLKLAEEIAGWSKDPSTQVGCVVVGADRTIRSVGFNGFPRSVEDHDHILDDRNLKYYFICHAEENAISQAARVGTPIDGCTAYVSWPPCSRCARSLLQAGINEIVYPEFSDIPDRWRGDFLAAEMIMGDAGRKLEIL